MHAISTTSPQVDFAVIGAQKGGTRALRHFLGQHPQIGLSRPQYPETHYFDRMQPQGMGIDTYHAMFTPQALARVTGDITPIYIFDPKVMPRLAAYNPDMKIIALLRDPVARAHSQWAMEHERGNDRRGFLGALLHEWWQRRRDHPVYSYLLRGFYARQVARILTYFPPEQCLFLRSEDLRDNHRASLHHIQSFLGVDPYHIAPPATIHARYYAPAPAPVRLALRLLFHRDIRRLEQMLGWDLSNWRAV